MEPFRLCVDTNIKVLKLKRFVHNMPTRKQKNIIALFLVSLIIFSTWGVFDKFGVFPCWVIRGYIIDNLDNPIGNAYVTARLGVGSERSVLTKDDGSFCLMVFLPKWSVSKGGKPSISVSKDGYKEHWVYNEQWSWGVNIKKVSIVLTKNSGTSIHKK